MSDLRALVMKHRKGRDAFDALAVEVSRLWAAGTLLPPIPDDVPTGEEPTLETRLARLTPDDVETALDGKLGHVAVTREEYRALLADITAFIQEWLGDTD